MGNEPIEAFFAEDGPASDAARAATERAFEAGAAEAHLDGATTGSLVAYGVMGAYLYHRALAEDMEREKVGE